MLTSLYKKASAFRPRKGSLSSVAPRPSRADAKDDQLPRLIGRDDLVVQGSSGKPENMAAPKRPSGKPAWASSGPAKPAERFRQVARKHAHKAYDLHLVLTLCDIIGIDVNKVDTGAMRVLLRCCQLFHCCGYELNTTLHCMALAAMYGRDTGVGGSLAAPKSAESLQVRVCMLLFVAHVYLVDEPCFLATWHRYIFKGVCSLEDLNGQVMKLFRQLGFRLDANAEDRQAAFLALELASSREIPLASATARQSATSS